MLFAINESGDLNMDKERGIFSDYVIGNENLTNFRIAKTIILTHLVHKKWFENTFLHTRNILEENEITNIIQEKLNEIFFEYQDILPTIMFTLTKERNELIVVFYKSDATKYGLLLEKEIKIS